MALHAQAAGSLEPYGFCYTADSSCDNICADKMNRDDIISFLRDFKTRNTDKYGIISLGVFGSVARGDIRDDSDVDIYVTTKTPDPFPLVHAKEEIEASVHRHVDIIRIRERMNPFLKQQIEKEGINV